MRQWAIPRGLPPRLSIFRLRRTSARARYSAPSRRSPRRASLWWPIPMCGSRSNARESSAQRSRWASVKKVRQARVAMPRSAWSMMLRPPKYPCCSRPPTPRNCAASSALTIRSSPGRMPAKMCGTALPSRARPGPIWVMAPARWWWRPVRAWRRPSYRWARLHATARPAAS